MPYASPLGTGYERSGLTLKNYTSSNDQEERLMTPEWFFRVRRLAHFIYPRPRGMGAWGKQSMIIWPWRIQGANSICLGADVIIQSHAWLGAIQRWGSQEFSPLINIDSHVRIGRHIVITAIEHVSIGEGCLLSEQVFISDHTHKALPGPVSPSRQPLQLEGPVTIGRHCFIGIRAVIMGGVTLGDYCIVGANSVVTRSFPNGSIIAGSPARLIRRQHDIAD